MHPGVPAARRLEHVRYAILNIVAEAARLEAAGRKILYCNIGDPLKFDFQTPPHLIEAVTRALRDGDNGYGAPAGLREAREAVVRDAAQRSGAKVGPDEVIITAGATEAVDLTLTALLEPGDEVLVPSPGYPLYNATVAKLGAVSVPYHLDEAHGWSLDLVELEEKCTPRTRAVMICNPNNPTGGMYSKQTLLGLMEIARRHRLVVLSDDIYERFSYDDPPTPLTSLADDVPIVTFNGLSKAYLTCGWRLGWILFSTPKLTSGLRSGVLQLADARLCSPVPVQHAIRPALEGPQDHLTEMLTKLRHRRELTLAAMRKIPGISVTAPAGAFYVMPRIDVPGTESDETFVLELLRETGVLFVHGDGFGQKPGTRHFRIVFLPPPTILEDAFERLRVFMERYASRA